MEIRRTAVLEQRSEGGELRFGVGLRLVANQVRHRRHIVADVAASVDRHRGTLLTSATGMQSDGTDANTTSGQQRGGDDGECDDGERRGPPTKAVSISGHVSGRWWRAFSL